MCMLSDNTNYPYHSCWCYGDTHWPPSTGSSDTGEARSAADRLWSLGLWYYLHPTHRHSILTRIKKSDTIFTMGVDVMRPVFNLEPKYRVSILTREEQARGPGTPPAVKGIVWFTGGSRTAEGTGAGVYGHSVGRRLSIYLGKMLQSFRLKYMRYWSAFMKLKLRMGQRNMLVFALIARRF